MEITIKCDPAEEVTVHAAIKELCPCIGGLMCNRDVEITSLDVKFLKSDEEVIIYLSSDMTNMAVRKLSAAGSVFKILYHIMNDSFADLVHQMGDFDVLINRQPIGDEYSDTQSDMTPSFIDKNKVPMTIFEGI